MSSIKRTISVNFELRVYFTQAVFDCSNPLLQSVLAEAAVFPKFWSCWMNLWPWPSHTWPNPSWIILRRSPIGWNSSVPAHYRGRRTRQDFLFHVSEIHSQWIGIMWIAILTSSAWAAARCWMWLAWLRPRPIAGCVMFAFRPRFWGKMIPAWG